MHTYKLHRPKAVEILTLYFELFGFTIEVSSDISDAEIEQLDEKSMELTTRAISDSLGTVYSIHGKLDRKKKKFINDKFHLIERAYESHQKKDLKSLQMQGQKVFPDILRSLRIDLACLNEVNPIGTHDTGIFTSKFITFALQQLEFENRESRLSYVITIFLLAYL